MIEQADTMFKNYFTDYIYDEMLSSELEVNSNWKTLINNIGNIGMDGLASRQNDLNWYLSENGVTYNVYNDPEGLNRTWNLNVIPLIIHETEWDTIERGIKQRSELFNLILKDVYGKRELIRKGLLPQEVILSHRGFIRQCDQITYSTEKNLLIHAIDLARGPNGQMWVVNDRTQAPSGMGYALENRHTLSRVIPDLFKHMHVKKLSEYFQHLNELLLTSGPGQKENPNIVVLTPGALNETYFEHAYLASFLGYPLVHGNDLVVRDGFLWMKSLKGLKKIDVILRRVDDLYSDPLELRGDSQLGVPGLLEVVRRNNVTVVNPVGSRVLENPGLIPFLQGISKYYLNEDLILPQIATWWCGQPLERKYVLEHLHELIVKRIDRSNTSSMFFGYLMTSRELDELRQLITERPYRFVAQEKISFSTTPTFVDNHLEPRNSVWRTFSISHKKEYSIMPGGLVRVAAERGNINVSNQSGGSSKDIWIVTNDEIPKTIQYTWNQRSMQLASGIDDLPSHTAENLFWAGRYVGRILTTARFIRMVLKHITFLECDNRKPNSEGLQLLLQTITHITSTYPGFIETEQNIGICDQSSEIYSVIIDKEKTGSLAYSMEMFANNYYSIRNLWSPDMCRVFDRMEKIWKNLVNDPEVTTRKLISGLDQLITRLIAFMGLVEESILIEQGLLMYFIGLQLEQSMQNISKCRALLTVKHSDLVEYEILEALLTSNESLNIYRYSFRSMVTIENVIELLMLDVKYPRSLAYQLNRLNKDLAVLPHSRLAHELTDYQKFVFEAFSKLRLAKISELTVTGKNSHVREHLDVLLTDLSKLLFNTSQTISNTYFSHTYKQTQLVIQQFTV